MLPNMAGLALREETAVPTGVDTPIAKKEVKKKKLKSSGKEYTLPGSEAAPCEGLQCASLKLVAKPVREAIHKLFANTNPGVLGSGVDNLDYQAYNVVVPVGMWQIVYGKDHTQRNAYIARKAAMLLENKRCDEYGSSHECVRTDKVLASIGDKMVGEAISPRLAEGINEKYLVHGTNAGVLSSIIQSRFKPELSQKGRQAFGAGIYQAEDVGKADQYAKRAEGGADELDQVLNIRRLAEEFNPRLADLDTFYLLVTRTLLGCANHVTHMQAGRAMDDFKDMTKKLAFERNPSLDARGLVSYQFRPPYDSLIKEHNDVIRGGFTTGQKYREFLVQRADQVLPVMVVAYKRVMATPEPPFDYRVLQCDPWSDVVAVLAVNSSSSWFAKQKAVAQLRQGAGAGDAGLLIKAGAVDPLFSLVMEAVNVLRVGDEFPAWALDALVVLAALAQWASSQDSDAVRKPLKKRAKELALLMFAVLHGHYKNVNPATELLTWLLFDEPKGLSHELLQYLGFPTLVKLGNAALHDGLTNSAYNLVSIVQNLILAGNVETVNDFLAADGLKMFFNVVGISPGSVKDGMSKIDWIKAVSNVFQAVRRMFATLEEGVAGKTLRAFLQSALMCHGFLVATDVAFFADPYGGTFKGTHTTCAGYAIDVCYALTKDSPSGSLGVMNGFASAQLDPDALAPGPQREYSEREIQARMWSWYAAGGPRVIFNVLGSAGGALVVHEWEPAVRVALRMLNNLFKPDLRIAGFTGTEGDHRELVHDLLMRYKNEYTSGEGYDVERRNMLHAIVKWSTGGWHYEGGDKRLNVRMGQHRVEIEELADALLNTLAAYDKHKKTAEWIADVKAIKWWSEGDIF